MHIGWLGWLPVPLVDWLAPGGQLRSMKRMGEMACADAGMLVGSRHGIAGHLVDPAGSHMLVSKIKPCRCLIAGFILTLWMAH